MHGPTNIKNASTRLG